MNLTQRLVLTVMLALLVTLHFTLRPLLDWRAGVDFLVIGVLLVAVRVRPGVAALTGLLVGTAIDSMTPEALGAGALAMTLVGFLASRLKAAFFTDELGLNAVFVFLGKVAYDWVSLLAEGRLSGMTLVWQLVAWTPLSALATAAVGLLVLGAVRPVMAERRFG
ncbi:rod shape-determining protein MreD [Pseudogemmatithrix spongiicola]|uniref:Rod shape-determining protein MreD n=1 Tax=Pseudogemmatithrix spongiicola TaxID=3062599 RepID=A0AA49JUQ8_9BACT|nr:rod shape-determining protein MreD [Gemmatimonadaceae bacterium 'strain 138']WKW15261.1 rod shape-determining protein MreD [Gemmatimonadaceae bacterium 'strain 318']